MSRAGLARLSHQVATATAHLRTLTRDFGVRLLDLPTGTPPGPNPEISRQSTNLHPLATRPGARGGLALLACALLVAACGGEEPAPEEAPVAPEELVREGPHEIAVLALEELGEIRIELLPELAPESVAHFKKLVEEGVYDGTSFHRVIPGFMIQGGDPLTKNIDPRDDGRGGTDYDITDEFSDMPHARGVVSLANKGRHHTAGSQFFIVQQDTPQLDGMFTVFARVVEGIEVVDAVTELEIDKYGRYGPTDRPYPKDARITSIRLEPADPS